MVAKDKKLKHTKIRIRLKKYFGVMFSYFRVKFLVV